MKNTQRKAYISRTKTENYRWSKINRIPKENLLDNTQKKHLNFEQGIRVK